MLFSNYKNHIIKNPLTTKPNNPPPKQTNRKTQTKKKHQKNQTCPSPTQQKRLEKKLISKNQLIRITFESGFFLSLLPALVIS